MESHHQHRLLKEQKEVHTGLPVPLFERFEEWDDARIGEPYRIQNIDLLRESIQREIGNLLNTRLTPRLQAEWSTAPHAGPQTVLDYGLPELASLSASNPFDVLLLSRTVVEKISVFEPRLENPQLELHPVAGDPTALEGVLRGVVRLSRVVHPVDFPVCFRPHGETAVLLHPAGTECAGADAEEKKI